MYDQDAKLLSETYSTLHQSVVLTAWHGHQLTLIPKEGKMIVVYKNEYGTHEIGYIEETSTGINVLQVVRGGGFSGHVKGATLSTEIGRLRLGNAILCMILADTEEVAAGDN